MAATRLIALHVNKGKTVAQCLADRTDYSQNAAKTNDGEFISSYECDPKTADEEFLLSKRQYQHITGRQQKNNIIAYQIRQSFKPGEITPEEACWTVSESPSARESDARKVSPPDSVSTALLRSV